MLWLQLNSKPSKKHPLPIPKGGVMSTLPHFVEQLVMAESWIDMEDVSLNWVMGKIMVKKKSSLAMNDMNGV